jgi:hypothetical protein
MDHEIFLSFDEFGEQVQRSDCEGSDSDENSNLEGMRVGGMCSVQAWTL